MEWLKRLTPSSKIIILTGTGVSVAFLAYSIYQKCQESPKEDPITSCHSPVPVREASSWLKDDIGGVSSPEVVGASKDLRGDEEVSISGWLTPTPSNGNLICREVQNAEEMFETISPRGPTESTCMVEDIEVETKVRNFKHPSRCNWFKGV